MRRLRMLVLLALMFFAYWSGSAAAADSMSDKWLSPAPSAAKKNPIAEETARIEVAAGQKIYSKTCAMCHGKTGDADGPAVMESESFTRRSSQTRS